MQKPKKKRGPGRPAIGRNYVVRLSDVWMMDIDRWAKESGLTRSEMIRRLIEAGADKLYRPRGAKPAKSA